MSDLEARCRRVAEDLARHPRVVVALSGGVDSAALLALAAESLGASRVDAVTGVSDAVTAEEIRDAKAVAAALGIRHRVTRTREMDNPEYRANTGDRCFHCRVELFKILSKLADEAGGATVVYGAIVDDLGDDRPGMRAADRLGIRAPLLEAGIGKDDVRRIASRYRLPVHDKPASPCLASRLPVGTEVTAERLIQIAKAERSVRALGFRELRVRYQGETGRLELSSKELFRLGDPRLRERVLAAIRAAGFREAVVDPGGYRQGGANGAPGRLHRIGPARDGGQ